MSTKVVFSQQARAQARAAAICWREHRPAAPALFAMELRAALMRLAAAPG